MCLVAEMDEVRALGGSVAVSFGAPGYDFGDEVSA